jgi:hypothetical protein
LHRPGLAAVGELVQLGALKLDPAVERGPQLVEGHGCFALSASW